MNNWAALFAIHILPLHDMFTESVWEVNRMLHKLWCLFYAYTRGQNSVLKSHTNWNVLFFSPKCVAETHGLSFSHLASEDMMCRLAQSHCTLSSAWVKAELTEEQWALKSNITEKSQTYTTIVPTRGLCFPTRIILKPLSVG